MSFAVYGLCEMDEGILSRKIMCLAAPQNWIPYLLPHIPGVVLNSGQFPTAGKERDCMLGTGPMCRFAVDLDPVLRIMAGSYGLAKLKLDEHVDLRSLRYFSMGDDVKLNLVSALDPELVDAQDQVSLNRPLY